MVKPLVPLVLVMVSLLGVMRSRAMMVVSLGGGNHLEEGDVEEGGSLGVALPKPSLSLQRACFGRNQHANTKIAVSKDQILHASPIKV